METQIKKCLCYKSYIFEKKNPEEQKPFLIINLQTGIYLD